MSRDPIRIGVVGSGFGLALASTLASMERYRVVGLVDRNADRNVEAIATRFGATGYRDIDSMLDGQRPDAVVLAVPRMGARRRSISFFVKTSLCFSKNRSRELWSRRVA